MIKLIIKWTALIIMWVTTTYVAFTWTYTTLVGRNMMRWWLNTKNEQTFEMAIFIFGTVAGLYVLIQEFKKDWNK